MTSDRTEPEVAAEGAHHGGLREDQLKAEIQALQSEAAALRVERDEAKRRQRELQTEYNGVRASERKAVRDRIASEAREAALRERVGELEKGLEPFARVDRDLPQEQPDDLTCAIHTSITSMGGAYAQRGDFRRAAQLLKDNPNG